MSNRQEKKQLSKARRQFKEVRSVFNDWLISINAELHYPWLRFNTKDWFIRQALRHIKAKEISKFTEIRFLKEETNMMRRTMRNGIGEVKRND